MIGISKFSDTREPIMVIIGTVARLTFLYAPVPVMIPTDISIEIYM